jgi:hypothetical protein
LYRSRFFVDLAQEVPLGIIVVVYNDSVVDRDRIADAEVAQVTTGEELVIDEAGCRWRFADSCKYSIWGWFHFGKGPTPQKQHDHYWYPETLTVFDRTDTRQLETVFDTIRADLPVGFGENAIDD